MRLKSLKLRRPRNPPIGARQNSCAARRGSSGSFPGAGPAGRVRHDERGMAVWDWRWPGEFAGLSATNVMRKLNIDDLAIEQTQRAMKAIVEPTARDAGGGGDPYNQRKDAANPSQQYSRSGGNPYDSGASGDPYNQRATPKRPAPPMNRPLPEKAATKAPAGSVLDQLTGKKK